MRHSAGRAPKDETEGRTASVGLRIRPSLKAALQDRAQAEDRTLNFYIERLLEEHVDGKPPRTGSYLKDHDLAMLR
jgi:hypothetical protein